MIGENWQAQARRDFACWRAGALVLVPQLYDEQLRETVDKLVGRPGKWVGGVWVWDLHEGTESRAQRLRFPDHDVSEELSFGL